MCRKIFTVLFVSLFVYSSLFAWAIAPSSRSLKPIEDMPAAEGVAVPAVEVQKGPEAPYELLSDLSAKTRLTAEQAAAIAVLKVSVEDLEEDNIALNEENDALRAQVEKAGQMKLGLGLGITYTGEDGSISVKEQFGGQLLASLRKGKTAFIMGAEYPALYNLVSEGDYNGNRMRYSFSVIREF